MKISLASDLEQLTQRIIGCAFEVSTALGHGFLESVYKKALIRELERNEIAVAEEVPFKVLYRGVDVGTYFADLVVEGLVIVELKAVEALTDAHKGQVLNYLRASGLRTGLLLNFGKPKVEVRRVLA